MKLYIQVFALILGVIIFGSCTEFDDDLSPVSQFSLSTNQASSLEVIQLTNEGRGEFFSVYSGVIGNNYEFRDRGDVGESTNSQGDASISYDTAGTFTIAFVASTFANGVTTQAVSFQTVTITDTINSIQKITFSVDKISRIGNSSPVDYVVESIPSESNQIGVPVFNYTQYGLTTRPQVSLQPNIFTGSRSTRFDIENTQNFINNESVVSHYNFESRYRPITYKVTSQSGISEEYLVSILEIPEFLEFSIDNGFNAINRIHPANDNEFYTTLPVPNGVDITDLTPVFDLYFPTETSVSFEGVEVASGNRSYDFSNELEFNLDFVQEGFEDQFSISSITHVRAVEIPVLSTFSIDGVEGVITLESDDYPSEYYVDITLTVPDSIDVLNADMFTPILNSLKPEFSFPSIISESEVRLENGNTVQTSGESSVNFVSYYAQFLSNPNSFNLDDARVTYVVENHFPTLIQGITIDRAYSLETRYSVAVILKNDD